MNHVLFIAILAVIIFFSPSLSVENAVLVDLSRTELTERDYKVAKTIKEEKCLTEAIYYEAGNQSEIGKEAVALVIMNRVGAPKRPKTICGVIAQAHVTEDRTIYQFSYFGEPRRKPNKIMWKESQEIAHRVLQSYWKRGIISQYSNASYFHADYVKPKWRKSKVFLGQIDNHLFYGEPQ